MRFASLLMLCLVTGCAVERTYTVSVKNNTDQPLTLGLIKFGPPLETAWMSPEDMAIKTPSRLEWGNMLPPHKIADLHQTGHFGHNAVPFVRIYRGQLSLGEMLATGRRDPSRLDLPLASGDNALVINSINGKLAGIRVPFSNP